MFNQLRTRYRARYGANPYRLASLGYDAVLLTVRIAKNWRLGRPFPERELRDPAGFAGVDGAFRFGRERDRRALAGGARGHGGGDDHRVAGAAELRLIFLSAFGGEEGPKPKAWEVRVLPTQRYRPSPPTASRRAPPLP